MSSSSCKLANIRALKMCCVLPWLLNLTVELIHAESKAQPQLSHHVNTLLVIQHQSLLSLTGANNKTTEVFKSWGGKPLKPQKQDNCLVFLKL